MEAIGARLFLGAMRGLSLEHASALGGRLGRAVGPLSGAHRTAMRNLAMAFPELGGAARLDIAMDAWENMGRTMAEYGVLPRLWPNDWRTRISVSGHEPLAALAAQRKPAILFSAHLGNWETLPIAVAGVAAPMTIVYRAPNNPAVDGMIGRVRSAYTSGMAPKGSAGARVIMRALEAGELLLMIVDQKINEGLEIPFFGRAAFTGPAIARLAMRFGCPVIPVHCERRDGCRFHVTVEEPWDLGRVDDPSEEVLRAALVRINGKLEEWIRARPGQWLWMHKRWPT
jgi:KDO2-lipid IV(A) lauroyltransferase